MRDGEIDTPAPVDPLAREAIERLVQAAVDSNTAQSYSGGVELTDRNGTKRHISYEIDVRWGDQLALMRAEGRA